MRNTSIPTPTSAETSSTNSEPLCILGIDPGSQRTGYGLIEMRTRRHRYLDSGCIRLDHHQAISTRLGILYSALCELIDRYQPQHCAIEEVFVYRNAQSALKLGQARGVALCAAAQAQLNVAEYMPARIKQAVVGNGRASKLQVQHMVTSLLALNASPQADAADALAVALCHAATLRTQSLISP